MKTQFCFVRSAALVVCIAIGVASYFTARAQGTAFGYQGRLNDNAGPANGVYDLRFTLFNGTNLPGNVLAGPVTNAAVTAKQGLFSVTLDFGRGVFNGSALWLQVDVRTNGDTNFTSLWPRQAILSVPYAVSAGGASNLLGRLSVSQLSGMLPATQVTGTVSVAQLPATVLTNGATGVALSGIFNGDGSGLTNISTLMGNADYENYSHSQPALGLWVVADDGNTVPLFSVSQDSGARSSIDGTVTTWGYDMAGDSTYNAGRFLGASWNWELQAPGSDIRSIVLKGAASQAQSDGAYFILETAAGGGSPGSHGVFNNSLYVSRSGLMALGNLTDAADYDTSLPIEPYLTGWVNIFPDGSAWSGGSAALPPLVIASQSLTAQPVPNSVENNGSAWWLTDGSGKRAKIVTTTVATPIYAHVVGTNVFFSTQP